MCGILLTITRNNFSSQHAPHAPKNERTRTKEPNTIRVMDNPLARSPILVAPTLILCRAGNTSELMASSFTTTRIPGINNPTPKSWKHEKKR